MRDYIYLVEITWQSKGKVWVTTAHHNGGDISMMSQSKWKWYEVMTARVWCRSLAKTQGTNKRLELQVRTKDGQIKIKDSYGSDPRTRRG